MKPMNFTRTGGKCTRLEATRCNPVKGSRLIGSLDGIWLPNVAPSSCKSDEIKNGFIGQTKKWIFLCHLP